MKRNIIFVAIFSLLTSLAAPSGAVFALSEMGEGIAVETANINENLKPETVTVIEDEVASADYRIPLVSNIEDRDAGIEGRVVISFIQTSGGTGKTNEELVELYNNSEQEVDVTGWCIESYKASKPNDAIIIGCIKSPTANQGVVLLSKTPYIFVSKAYVSANGGFVFNQQFTVTDAINNKDGRIVLRDGTSKVHDAVTWGDDRSALLIDQGNQRAYIGSSTMLARFFDELTEQYIDTDNNRDDFIAEGVVDTCLNAQGLQLSISDGYERRADGSCAETLVIEFCQNLPGVRLDELSLGSEVDDEGNCHENKCTNLPGFYGAVPTSFDRDGQGKCLLNILPLEVTEVLPNPKGDDKGAEFIEIYNPNDEVVDLKWWAFYLNDKTDKTYTFPEGAMVGPGEYYVYKNTDNVFSLVNTKGSLRLWSIDGQYNSVVPEWSNAKDDKAWSLVDGGWQYLEPSPGSANSLPITIVVATAGLADCGEGRERNPLTGRCRNIPAEKELTPCKEGQYRSEETNRCRSIASAASSVLKPCADDQFRNPETNRCKKIASVEELADCGEGRERNPETNRCRNVVAASMPLAPFAAEQVTQVASGTLGWWALGGVSLLAVGYAGWQWRFELGKLSRRISGLFVSSGK